MDFDDVTEGVGYAFKLLGQLFMVAIMWVGMIAAGAVVVQHLAALLKGLLKLL